MATNPEVIPKELRYGGVPTIPQSRSYLFKQRSEYVEYDISQGSTIEINIPRLQRTYLTKDSYLKFNMVFNFKIGTAGTQATKIAYSTMDRAGAFGLFDRIEVYDYMGSTLLERISGVGDLMLLLMDSHTDSLESSNFFNVTAGTGFATVDTGKDATSAAVFPNVMNPNLGDILWGAQDSTLTASKQFSVVRQFCIPIPSFLGLFSNKFIPLHNGFTLKLVCNNPEYAVICTTGGSATFTEESITLGNIEFCAQVLELGPVAEGLIMSSSEGQPISLHTKTFRLFKDVVSGSYGSSPQSSFRLDLDLNVISLTNLLWFFKPLQYYDTSTTSTKTIPAADSSVQNVGQRVRNYLERWNFQYGSSFLPNVNGIYAMQSYYPTLKATTPSNWSYQNQMENYVEFMKARHMWSAERKGTCINGKEYFTDTYNPSAISIFDYNDDPDNQNLSCGKFASGLDLELVSGKSGDVICGINTNGMNTCINGYFTNKNMTSSDGTGTCDALILCWAEYDAFVNIMPGVATTVSF